MNFGVLQLNNISSNSNTTTQSTQSKNSIGSSFGEIFSQINNPESAILANSNVNPMGNVDIQQLDALLNANSVEEVLDLLGVPHNEGLTLIETGDEKVVAIDELLNNMGDLLSILKINQEELKESMKELLGQEGLDANNLWEVINIMNNPELTSPILLALKGEHTVTPESAEKLLKVLKLTQIVGGNTDLLSAQEEQLVQIKEFLKVIANEITSNIKNNEISQNKTNILLVANTVPGQLINRKNFMSGNESSINNYQNLNQLTQVISEKVIIKNNQQVVKGSETVDENQTLGTIPNTTVTTKTISITLPAEKSGQSEALAKEIQNLMNRSQISNTQGTMKLLVKLYPENLGSIRIEIFQKDGVLSARLLASTPQAKELLDNQIQQLKTSFSQQNIQMDRIDVAQSLQETDRNSRDQSQFNNLFKQHQSEKDEDEREEHDEEESISFSDYLLNEEV